MDKTEQIDYVLTEFNSAGIIINREQAEKYVILCNYMLNYNNKVNLTAITDFREVVMKHFIDSVLPFSKMEIKNNSSIIDVGTGAGFPSLPLLIYRPDLKATLCDSLAKRCTYLELVCKEIGVSAEIVHSRAEELGQKRRECYDYSTARAVAALPVLTEFCLPFVKVGGHFVALKSVNESADSSQHAVSVLGGSIEEITDYDLPNGDKRRLIMIKKVMQTPTKYPRSYSNITKKPL